MAIKLPPTVVSQPKPSTTGTTGTQSAFQPGKPQAVAGPQQVGPQDLFGQAQLATAAQAQLSGRDELRPVGQLVSDLKGVVDAETLPGRLAGDLAVHLPELISLLHLTRQQKATRLMEFLAPYAEKLSELAQKAEAAGVPMPDAQREKLGEQLVAPMREAGLAQVVETTTGQTGPEVAEQMMNAATPQDVKQLTETMKFDAPQWASRPEAQNANEVKRGEPALVAQPNLPPTAQRELRRLEEEEAAKKKDRGDKKLGGNMVWNTLHFLRGGDDAEDLTPEKQKELLMATGGIIVVVVVVAVAIALALLLK